MVEFFRLGPIAWELSLRLLCSVPFCLVSLLDNYSLKAFVRYCLLRNLSLGTFRLNTFARDLAESFSLGNVRLRSVRTESFVCALPFRNF